MVPTSPGARFTVGHAQVALGVVKELLHTPARAASQRRLLQRRRFICIGYVVSHFAGIIQRTLEDRPTRRPRLPLARRPNPLPCVLVDQRAFRSLAKLDRVPSLVRQLSGQLTHRADARLTPASLAGGTLRS